MDHPVVEFAIVRHNLLTILYFYGNQEPTIQSSSEKVQLLPGDARSRRLAIEPAKIGFVFNLLLGRISYWCRTWSPVWRAAIHDGVRVVLKVVIPH